MHELAIVEALIDQVKEELARAGQNNRVIRLDLKIGRLSGVNSDSVRFAFELLSPGTIIEHAELAIDEPRASCCCRACGEKTEIDALVVQCPGCGSPDITIEGGRETLLQSIELEDAD